MSIVKVIEVIAESEKNLLIFGQPLSEKDQQQPQVIAFLELLLNFGIKTITFEASPLEHEPIKIIPAAISGSKLKIKYAMKALSNINILRLMNKNGIGIDAVSVELT